FGFCPASIIVAQRRYQINLIKDLINADHVDEISVFNNATIAAAIVLQRASPGPSSSPTEFMGDTTVMLHYSYGAVKKSVQPYLTRADDGACGYGDLFEHGYGLETTALSPNLFHKGRLTHGACYEVRRDNSKWCLYENSVAATNLCPDQSSIQCGRSWRRSRMLKGYKYKLDSDVARQGGPNWQTGNQLVGHYLSFRVTTNDSKMVQSDNVAPHDWKFGHVYKEKQFLTFFRCLSQLHEKGEHGGRLY
ncbi:hypothetical protein RJ639_002376, partial [Escallonia herrerae]